MIVGAMSDDTKLILKRSSLAHAGFDDFDVLCEGELVGRIYHGKSGSGDSHGSGAWPTAITRTARQHMATRRTAKRPCQRSPRAGGGNSADRSDQEVTWSG
jgi:hypothetical protein